MTARPGLRRIVADLDPRTLNSGAKRLRTHGVGKNRVHVRFNAFAHQAHGILTVLDLAHSVALQSRLQKISFARELAAVFVSVSHGLVDVFLTNLTAAQHRHAPRIGARDDGTADRGPNGSHRDARRVLRFLQGRADGKDGLFHIVDDAVFDPLRRNAPEAEHLEASLQGVGRPGDHAKHLA